MQSVREKITLYDILGYLFPGVLFEIIIGGIHWLEMFRLQKIWDLIQIVKIANELKIYITVIVIISGYCLGILISEISFIIYKKILKNIRIVKKNKEQNTSGVTEESLEKALIKFGISKIELDKVKTTTTHLQKEYGKIMYGVIQSDEKYRRIHNYASSELMYRNLSCVLLIGSFWMLIHIKGLGYYACMELFFLL